MRGYTRFIPGEEIGDIAQWRFGAVDAAALLAVEQARAKEEALLHQNNEALHQAGYSEGYAQGFAQGHAQATLDGQKQINDYINLQGKEAAQGFARLFESAQARLAESEQVIAEGVLELACELARQIVRQELSVNPNVLQPLVREALRMLVADSKSAMIRLNPLDVEVLREVLQDEFPDLSLTLRADPAVSRGGCLVQSASTVVDGSLEKRWLRAVANLGLSLPWAESLDEL